MSEKPMWPYVAAGVGALVIGGHELNKVLPPPSSEVAKTEMQAFQTGVAEAQSQSVLEGGSAQIDLLDTTKHANIINPVLTKTGHVIGRDKYTGEVVVYYVGDQADANYNSQGVETAQKITFTENGHEITEEQAIKDATKEVVSPPEQVDGQTAYIAEQGQTKHAVGVDSPIKTVTVTKTKEVPDKS